MRTARNWALGLAYGNIVGPCLSEILDASEIDESFAALEADYWCMLEALIGEHWQNTP